MRNMPLDPQVEAMRAERATAGAPPLYTLTVAQARAEDLKSIQDAGGDPEPVADVLDEEVPGPGGPIPIRIYRPSADRPLPVLVYFFGGGWTLGTIDTSDGVCRALTNQAKCMTITVGYRLAPEHKFPAAVEDCHAAIHWIAENATDLGIDPDRIAVGGDSAGGNLAAAVALMARDKGGPKLAHQLLVYPNTDYLADAGSMRDNTDPLLFNRTSSDWYWGHYLEKPEDGTHPLASPLRAPDHTNLPTATVITAEYDPLRDQAEAYAHKLAASGVQVHLSRYPGMVHGFFTMSGKLNAARDAVAEAAARLREAFGTDPAR